ATTCTSGAATGTTRITMLLRPSAILADRKAEPGAPPAAAPGAITSKCRVAARDRASHLTFNMRITGSAWQANWSFNPVAGDRWPYFHCDHGLGLARIMTRSGRENRRSVL